MSINNPQGILSATGSYIFQSDWFQTKELSFFNTQLWMKKQVYSARFPYLYNCLKFLSLYKW